MNKAIRILVANRPKLMREALLGTLSDQSWIRGGGGSLGRCRYSRLGK